MHNRTHNFKICRKNNTFLIMAAEESENLFKTRFHSFIFKIL